MKSLSRFGCLIAAVGVVWCASVWADSPQPPTAQQIAHFEQKALPLLKQYCFKCHGGEKNRGGLKLTSRETILKGGDTGPAVDLAKPGESLLLKAINYQDALEMPPTGKLGAEEIKVLEEWVKAGAPWPPGTKVETKAETKEAHKPTGGVVTAESKNYWAYKPVVRPAVPAIQVGKVANPIDAFILAKIAAKNHSGAKPEIIPNSMADRLTLIRRATYDLTGLPPTPEEVDAFLQDGSSDAYEKLIDRLLASPHYGEKWGRHWLDVVRYAETNGYERDGPKPFAWRFRDYVIQSFNDDKPIDQFIREQLAGDELPGHNPQAIIATGFYRLGLWDDEPADPKLARLDELDDFVATTGQAFLGMTMNCARCHDHKIDPIPQADYYRLLAFFQDIPRYSNDRNVKSTNNLTDVTPPEQRVLYEKEFGDREERIEKLDKQMQLLENEAIKRMPEEEQRAAEGLDRPAVVKKLGPFLGDKKEEYDQLRKEHARLKRLPEPKRELALSINRCKVNPPPTFIMIRGNAHSPGAGVSPGYPSVLTDKEPVLTPPARDATSSGRRTVLANWIASPQNPLTARVFVNRLWQHHFGRGIVASTNDFGKFGTPPTHPELLDWLASDFLAGGWKVKRMHKLIMLSDAYQRSSRASEAGMKLDPDNTLIWRFNMRRLLAEEVRDSILAVSGSLNKKMGGPSIYPPIPREVLAGQSMPGNGWTTSSQLESPRRSVYIHVKRSLQVPILSAHDQADTDSSCPVRYTTTVPTQALGMLNGEFTNEQARALADRLMKEHPGDLSAQVKYAIRLTTGRVPGEDEILRDVKFVRNLQEKHEFNQIKALQQYALLVLNANEFVYLD